MRNQKKIKRKKLNNQKPKINVLVIFFVIISIYFVTTFIDQQVSMNRYQSQIQMYQADIKNKEALAKHYEQQQDNIKSDEYIEQVAREMLGLVKPYEKIFVDVNK